MTPAAVRCVSAAVVDYNSAAAAVGRAAVRIGSIFQMRGIQICTGTDFF